MRSLSGGRRGGGGATLGPTLRRFVADDSGRRLHDAADDDVSASMHSWARPSFALPKPVVFHIASAGAKAGAPAARKQVAVSAGGDSSDSEEVKEGCDAW